MQRGRDRVAVELPHRDWNWCRQGVELVRGGSSFARTPSSFDARLAEALGSLPRAQREAVALHYLLDVSVSGVAEHLGVADGTVKSHLHRGRAPLRAALRSAPSEENETHV